MDYEILYKNALERAKKFIEENPLVQNLNTWIKETFPELKEPEDEKVRKALIEMVHDTTGDELWVDYNVHKEEALAWLEKQAEIKSDNDDIEAEEKGIRKAFNKIWEEKQDKQKSQRMISAEAKEAMYDKPADKVEPKCEESKTKVFDAPTPFEDKLYAFVTACEFLTLPAKIEFIKEHSQELLDAAKEQTEKKHEEDMELIKGLLEELNKKTFKPPFNIKTFPESKPSDPYKPFDPWGHTCVYACPTAPYDSNITTSTTDTLNKDKT
jgi:hypothetical protein